MERTLFDTLNEDKDKVVSNAPTEYSVSQISQQLKNCVESNFSYIRVRGELSRVTVAKSGHLYTTLKDDNSVLDAICWKGNLQRLSVQPEEGLDVVCTGRLTTYAGRSNYQMIIETMELAGEGALLKMLEDRRKKLAAEGLFDESRKKTIPFLPEVIGVVTSPTGAVISDIMHRIADRFPCRVLLWPVVVQGQRAAEQVIAGIKGFNDLPKENSLRPDVLIVARGGGSLEDLMPFNDEAVVRAVAESDIPLISAVGHETDTTLIDYVADLRAPTPTGAAEKAVPVKTQIVASVLEYERRMVLSVENRLTNLSQHLEVLERGLGNPLHLLEVAMQRMDQSSIRLDLSLKNWLTHKKADLRNATIGLSVITLRAGLKNHQQRLDDLSERLRLSMIQNTEKSEQKLLYLSSLLESLSFKKTLDRGFVLVKDKATGQAIKHVSSAINAENVTLQFSDGKISAIIDEK